MRSRKLNSRCECPLNPMHAAAYIEELTGRFSVAGALDFSTVVKVPARSQPAKTTSNKRATNMTFRCCMMPYRAWSFLFWKSSYLSLNASLDGRSTGAQ